MRVDRISTPVLPVPAVEHHLEMEVRQVLRGVAGGPDESQHIALTNYHPFGQSFLVAIEVGVVVDEPLVGVELVDRYSARFVLPELEDGPAVGGDEPRPPGR